MSVDLWKSALKGNISSMISPRATMKIHVAVSLSLAIKPQFFYVLRTSYRAKAPARRSFDFHSRSRRLSLNESFRRSEAFRCCRNTRAGVLRYRDGIRRTPFAALIKPTSRSRYPRAPVIPYNSLVAVITRRVQYTEKILPVASAPG